MSQHLSYHARSVTIISSLFSFPWSPVSIVVQSSQTTPYSPLLLGPVILSFTPSSKDLAPTSSTLMGTIIGCGDDGGVGKKKILNSSLFSFPSTITTYDFLRREDWEQVREKILMEDIVTLVGEFLVGWEGGLVRALDGP